MVRFSSVWSLEKLYSIPIYIQLEPAHFSMHSYWGTDWTTEGPASYSQERQEISLISINVQKGSGAQPASYLTGTRATSPGLTSGAENWPLISNKCWGQEWWRYTSTPPKSFQSVVLNYLIPGITFRSNSVAAIIKRHIIKVCKRQGCKTSFQTSAGDKHVSLFHKAVYLSAGTAMGGDRAGREVVRTNILV
jgi:hypothetical protein